MQHASQEKCLLKIFERRSKGKKACGQVGAEDWQLEAFVIPEGCFSIKIFHESELWKSKAGVLVYKDRGGFKIDLATGQN